MSNSTSQAPEKRLRGSVRNIIAIYAAVMLTLFLGGLGYYTVQEQRLRQVALNDLESIAHLKVDQIVAWRAERLDRAGDISQSFFLKEAISTWMADPDQDMTNLILKRLQSFQMYQHFEDYTLVDTQGRVLLSLSGTITHLHPDALDSLQEALSTGQPVLNDLYADAELDPHIDLIAPLIVDDPSTRTARPIGAVILLEDANKYLYPLIQSWPVDSQTAETLLVRREGEEVLYLNNLRHAENTALTLRLPLTATDVPAVAAVLGQEGLFEGKDYRGVPVVSVIYPIPDSPWYMVAKVDNSEALAVLGENSAIVMGIVLLLAAIASSAAGVFYHRVSRRHTREVLALEEARRKAEERYRITLLSIGDAVITVDSAGRVQFMNPVAEEITGWSQIEAAGHPLGKVFNIINEFSHQPVNNPVDLVIQTGMVTGLANHTLLVARDGREIPIADSGSPIRDENGTVNGVVLVFRDQTQEREILRSLSESEEKFSQMFQAAPVAITLTTVSDGRTREVNHAFEDLTGYTRSEAIGKTESELELWADPELRPQFLKDLQEYGEISNREVIFRRKDGSLWTGLISIRRINIGREPHMMTLTVDISDRKRIERERQAAVDLQGWIENTQNEPDSYRNALAYLQEWTKCEVVGMRLQDGEEYPYYEYRGFPGEFLRKETHLCASAQDGSTLRDRQGSPGLECLCENIIRGRFDPTQPFFTPGGSFWSSSTSRLLASAVETDRQADARDHCLSGGYESVALVPLRSGKQTLGLLQFNDHRPGRFTFEMIQQLERLASTIAAAIAKKKVERQLKASEQRFRTLYEYSPVAFWEEDFSAVKTRFDELRAQGIQDFQEYLKTHPEEVTSLADLVKVLEVNRTSLKYFGVANKTELTLNLATYFLADSFPIFRDELAHLADGETVYQAEIPIQKLDGQPRILNLLLAVVPGYEQTLEHVMVSFLDVTDEIRSREQIQQSLAEKEVLLRELYHRTKNNMQVIHSMLVLQSAGSQNEDVRRLVQETGNKIQAMALVHQMLYQSKDLSNINLATYIQQLSALAVSGLSSEPDRVNLTLDLEPVLVPVDIATPVGLVLNELLTNSFKHAFPGNRPGAISIHLSRNPDGLLSLCYADDGVGVPPEVDLRQANSYGLISVFNIIEIQLSGTITWRRSPGLGYSIQFSPNVYGKRI